MNRIPGKVAHRKAATTADLLSLLVEREIGYCDADNTAYIRIGGELRKIGGSDIDIPTTISLLMGFEEDAERYTYAWKSLESIEPIPNNLLKLWSRLAGKGLYAEVASKDSKGREIATTLDNKTDATDMTSGTYTKVSVNEQGAVTDGDGLEASDLPTHEHSAEDITSGTLNPDRIGDGSVPIEKLEIHKRLYVDGVTLYAIESQDSVVLCVKAGGVGKDQLSPGFMFNKDPNYASNYASPPNSMDLNSYTIGYCNGQPVNVVFLNNGPNAFELNNGFIGGNIKRYVEGDYVLITNKAPSLSLGIRTAGGISDIKTIPAGSSSLFVCQYSGNETLTDNSVWVPVS